MMDEIPTLGDWLELAPWRTRAVAILRVLPGDSTRLAHTIADKRVLLDRYPHGSLLVLWTGRYRTDIRAMTAAEHQQVCDLLA